MKSVKSTIPATSTPTSCKDFTASGVVRICANSSFEISMSLSASRDIRICCNFPVTKFTIMSSFSVAETKLTTSQSTPMSMFMTVRFAKRIKTKRNHKQGTLSFWIAVESVERSSVKAPWINNVYIDLPTLGKYFFPMSVPAANCVNTIAKMYKEATRSDITEHTEPVEDIMPLMRIINSGMDRNMRAKRESLARRKSRKMDASPPTLEPPPPSSSVKVVIIQVSPTIMKTKQESNTNHASLKPSRFLLKAWKRTNHSREK
mmetsp:Transcript_30985/g.65920  ORF Transcript_30985/g.65920 Transcript_30985/m.65920 type:complete len:261 (-) Transcript_30985:428-1210(-)